MKKKILSTGLSGLVGSRIQEMFSDKYEFLNMDLSTGADITDKQAILDFINKNPADTLIHLAAFTNVNEANNQKGDKDGICYKVNVDGTQNIADICKEKGIYLIHISTDFVFAGDKQDHYTEEDPRNPIEWYGETKAMAEEAVEKTLNHYSIVRIGYPFRAKFEDKPDIVAKTIQGLKDGTLYPQFTDMIITPTFIDDLAKALDVIIDKQPDGIYHLNGSTSLSPFELAQEIAKVFNLDSSKIKEGSLEEFLKTTDRPYQKILKISNAKAKKELGVKISTIDEALSKIKEQLGTQ